MDLQLYFKVLYRFRLLAAVGLLLAVLLAIVSYARVELVGGSPKLTPRGSETWQSTSVIFITQEGFPWGRAVPAYTEPDPDTGAPPAQLGDQARFAALSQIYTQLANSDTVRARLLRSAQVKGTVKAEASADSSGQPLPLLTIVATSDTAAHASELAAGATNSFRRYVSAQQRSANIPVTDRIQLQVLERGKEPLLVGPRKKTLPGLMFFAVMLATFALIFILENIRPRLSERPGNEPWEGPAARDERLETLAPERAVRRKIKRQTA
jgi:hypothetical protein